MQVVEILIKNGADINKADNKGLTPVHAASTLNTPVMERLIRNGADIDKANNWGSTLLISASYDGCLETVKMLLKYKANKRLIDKNAKTALDSDEIKYNINNEIDIRLSDNGAWNRVETCSANKYKRIMEELRRT